MLAAPEDPEQLAQGDHVAHPVEQRGRLALLRLHVDRLVPVHRIHDHGAVQLGRRGAREARVAVRGPLHGRAHAVAVAQVHVVAHADLVAVVEDGRAGERQEDAVHQLDPPPVVVEQGRQAAADADVDPHLRIVAVRQVHVVALFRGHHLQRQLVVVAQEQPPLAGFRDVRGLAHDLRHRMAILEAQGHEQPGHEREVEGHVAFVAIAEVRPHVGRPLVGLGQDHAVRVAGVELLAQPLHHGVGFREILAARAVALDQVGNGIQAKRVHPLVEPEAHGVDHLADHLGIVEVEVRLVREEAVPEVGLGHRIPGPVRLLRVGEDDAGVLVLLVGVAPDVVVALLRAGRGQARRLEPRVLVRGVVDHQLDHDLHAARVRGGQESLELLQRAVLRMHVAIVGDVVTVVAQRRGKERQKPQAGDPEILQVVELLQKSREVADAVVVAVVEGLDVQLVDDRVLVPEGIAGTAASLGHAGPVFSDDGAVRESTTATADGVAARR